MSSTTEVISHWSTLIENFQYSPQQFYMDVVANVRKRKIPDISIGKVNYKEGNFLTANREYLRIWYKKDFYYAICGGPFGTGFFVSSWLLQPPDGCLVQLFSPFPFLSAIGKALAKPWTYYRADTATMFRTAAHSALIESVDQITAGAQGIRSLTEGDRKPILKDFFK